MVYIQISPLIITLVFSIYYLLIFSYKSIQKKASFLKNDLSLLKGLTSLGQVLLILPLFYIIFFLKGFNISNYFFGLSSQKLIIVSLWLSCSYILIFFFKKTNIIFIFLINFYIILLTFVPFINCLVTLYFFLELITYTFILLVMILLIFNRISGLNQPIKYFLIVTVILNFFFSLFFYIFLILTQQYFGVTNLTVLQITNIPNYIQLFFVLGFFFKLTFGPWFLWNINLYSNLPLIVLYFYITSMVVVVIPVFLALYINILTSVFFKLILFCIPLLILIILNKKIFNFFSKKIFLLFSSFTLYFLINILIYVY